MMRDSPPMTTMPCRAGSLAAASRPRLLFGGRRLAPATSATRRRPRGHGNSCEVRISPSTVVVATTVVAGRKAGELRAALRVGGRGLRLCRSRSPTRSGRRCCCPCARERRAPTGAGGQVAGRQRHAGHLGGVGHGHLRLNAGGADDARNTSASRSRLRLERFPHGLQKRASDRSPCRTSGQIAGLRARAGPRGRRRVGPAPPSPSRSARGSRRRHRAAASAPARGGAAGRPSRRSRPATSCPSRSRTRVP